MTMVRKKEGAMEGCLFALKSLSKLGVVEGGQVQHIKDEKSVRLASNTERKTTRKAEKCRRSQGCSRTSISLLLASTQTSPSADNYFPVEKPSTVAKLHGECAYDKTIIKYTSTYVHFTC